MGNSISRLRNEHHSVERACFDTFDTFDLFDDDDMIDVDETAHSPTLPSQPTLHAAMPISRRYVSPRSPPSPPPRTSTFKSFVSLPPELRDEVIFWILAKNPKARIPLLLTSKTVHESSQSVTQRAVAEYVKNQHGTVAAMLFTPMTHWWEWKEHAGWEEYVSKVDKLMGRIEGVSRYVRSQLKLIAEASEVAGVDWLDVEGLVATVKMGLYLVEFIQWRRPSSGDHARRRVLASLPPYGVLVIRMMSLLVTLSCRDRIHDEIDESHLERYGRRVGLDCDTYSMIRAVETMLLSNGSQHLATMISTDMPHPDERPIFEILGRERYNHAYAEWNERIRKVESARMLATHEFLKIIEVVRAYAQFPPGRLRNSQKTEIVSKRLQEHYGVTVPLYSVGVEKIVNLQELVEEEVWERSEMEVMKELKMAGGL